MADTKLRPLEQLDLDIIEAVSNYRLRLAAFDHCSSTQNEKDANKARALVDELLDRRYEMVREAEAPA